MGLDRERALAEIEPVRQARDRVAMTAGGP